MPDETSLEQATLAGGCFWCIEAAFKEIAGVVKVISGYTGGDTPDPTYKDVCSGQTGHAEAVQVTYDPEMVSYHQLLEVLFAIHDPTTRNRQGPDVGSQYRSAVFYHDNEQGEIVEDYIRHLEKEGMFSDPIVTDVAPLEAFYPAEDYHQDYYDKNPNQPYCAAYIPPKLQKLKKSYPEYLQESAASE